MARGYIYEVSDNVEDLNCVSEDDYYDKLGELAIDYVEDKTGEEKEECIEAKLKELSDYGFATGYEMIGETRYGWFFPTRELRHKFAEEAFKAFRKKAEKLTAEDFEKDSFKLWEVRQELKDTSGDLLIRNGGCEQAIMQWLADLPDDLLGKKFYFGNVILMH